MSAFLQRLIFTSPFPVATREIRINGIGVRERMGASLVDRPTGRSDWLLMFFFDSVQSGGNPDAPRHDAMHLMIWPPRARQFYGCAESSWTHSWMHCEGRLIGRLVRSLALPTRAPIPGGDPLQVDSHLLAILQELTGPCPADPRIVGNLVENWLRHVARKWHHPTGSGAQVPERFLEMQRYLAAHYNEPIRLKDLAARASLSVPHVCSEFKRHFGESPIQYVVHQRIGYAKYLLSNRNLTITEIARQVGYEDLYHFSKIFKKHTGVSPAAMRRTS